MAICRAADQIEPEQRDPRQLALEDDGEIVRVAEQREGFEERLVLGGEDVAALRDVLDAAKLDLEAAELFEQPQRAAAPQPRHEEHAVAAEQDQRQADDHQHDDVDVEGDVEGERAQRGHGGPMRSEGAGVHSSRLSWRKTIRRDSTPVRTAIAPATTAIAA